MSSHPSQHPSLERRSATPLGTLVGAALLGAALLSAPLAAVAADPDQVWVSVRKSSLRATPDYLGERVAKVGYTDALQVVAREGDWWKVSHDGKEGWIHTSAVSDTLKQSQGSGGGNGGSSAGGGFGGLSLPFGGAKSAPRAADTQGGKYSEDEVTLAGKGFNRDVEERYRGQAKVDYASVDAIEKRAPSDKSVATFARKGVLKPRPEPSDEGGSGPKSGLGGLFGN